MKDLIMKDKNNVCAVIWDYDGTLVDTKQKNFNVTKKIIKKFQEEMLILIQYLILLTNIMLLILDLPIGELFIEKSLNFLLIKYQKPEGFGLNFKWMMILLLIFIPVLLQLFRT